MKVTLITFWSEEILPLPVHKHIQGLRKDLNHSSSDINIFAETRFSSQDPNDLYDISGYSLFRNDNLNSSNGLVRPW